MSSYQLPATLKQETDPWKSDEEGDSCWQQCKNSLFKQQCEIKATATLAGVRAERVVSEVAYTERHGYCAAGSHIREEQTRGGQGAKISSGRGTQVLSLCSISICRPPIFRSVINSIAFAGTGDACPDANPFPATGSLVFRGDGKLTIVMVTMIRFCSFSVSSNLPSAPYAVDPAGSLDQRNTA